MKLTRYRAETLGGRSDYSLESDEDGQLCMAVDVEDLEERVRRLEAVAEAAREVVEQDVKVARTDGGENRLGISLANLEQALAGEGECPQH